MSVGVDYSEEHVLAGLLERPAHIRIVRDILDDSDFYFDLNADIWKKLEYLSTLQEFNGNPLDLKLLKKAYLNDDTWSEDVRNQIVALKKDTDAPKDVIAVARLLKQERINFATRNELEKLRGFLNGGMQCNEVDQLVEIVRIAAEKLCTASNHQRGYNLRSDANLLLKRARDRQNGIPTGFLNVDAKLRGLHGGDVTLVASRPSMGKSAWVTNIASHMAFNGKKVLFYSLEMSAEMVFERLLTSITSMTLQQLHDPEMAAEQAEIVEEAVKLYEQQDFIIECPASCSFADIRQKFDSEKLIRKPDCLIIDYLQLLKPEKPGRSRQEEVSDMSWAAKEFSRREQVPVILVCQLNRDNEKNNKIRRPMLSDLRESGSLEQDAHNVIFIHREDYYREREGKKKLDNIAEAIIAKNRQGPVGTVKLTFQGEYFLFRDYLG